MIRIFDEKAYIDNYIKNGFKNIKHWGRDAYLYVRWLKLPQDMGGCGEEYSKKQCEEKLIQKLKKLQHIDYSNGVIFVQKIVKGAWKNNNPLLVIRQIEVNKSVIDWFKRQGLKKNEIKLLFTLYMGYLIKLYKYKKQNCVWYSQITDREFLRSNSNISSSTSVKRTLNVYRDKGLIDHRGEKFAITFIDRPDFIECENDDSEKIIFKTEDLYNIGNTLFNYYGNYRYCLDCGRVISAEGKKKYCDDCFEKRKLEKDRIRLNNLYIKQENVETTCIKCGKTFTLLGSKTRKEHICDDCLKEIKKENDKNYAKENYEKQEDVTTHCIKCGKTFTLTTTSRRKEHICDDCLNEVRKQEDKHIFCMDCGKEFVLLGSQKRKDPICDDCLKIRRRIANTELKRKSRAAKKVST